MEQKRFFDIIIIGGGPAGLSVGSELSKKYNLLIIEKNRIGETSKTWTSWPSNLKNNNLNDCTYNYIKKGTIRAYPGDYIHFKARVNKKYPIINEKKVLKKWISILKKNNAKLLGKTSFIDYKHKRNEVIVNTTKGSFKTSLLIDASGFNSKIVKKKRLIKRNKYYWSVYGGIYRNVPGLPEDTYIIYETFDNKKPRLIWMYMPISKNRGIAEIFYLTKKPVSLDKMKRDFHSTIKRSKKYSKNFTNALLEEKKFGWVPIGRELKTNALNQVGIIGDAAGWDYALGWGFSYILLHYKKYTKNLMKLLKYKKLDKNSLNTCLRIFPKEDFQIRVEELTISLLAEAKGKDCNTFFRIMHSLDPKLFEKWLLLKLNNKDILKVCLHLIKGIKIKSLIKIIKKQKYSYLLKQTEEVMLDEIYQHLPRKK
jgi:flavin-dependent dehydrogenase